MEMTENTDFYEDMLNKYQRLNRLSIHTLDNKQIKPNRCRNVSAFKEDDYFVNQNHKYSSLPKKESKHPHHNSKIRHFKAENAIKSNDSVSPRLRSSGQNSKSRNNSPNKLKRQSISVTNPVIQSNELAFTNSNNIVSVSQAVSSVTSYLQKNKEMLKSSNIQDQPIKEIFEKSNAKMNLIKRIKKSNLDPSNSFIFKKFQNQTSEKSIIKYTISSKISKANSILLNALAKRKTALLEIQSNCKVSNSKSAYSVRSKSLMNIDFSNDDKSKSRTLLKRGNLLCCL